MSGDGEDGMPDNEMVKIGLQLGCFGLIVLGLVWWGRVGHPRLMQTFDRYSEQIERQRTENLEAQERQQREAAASEERQQAKFLEMLGVQQRLFAETLATQTRELVTLIGKMEERSERESMACREERRQQARTFREALTEQWDRVSPLIQQNGDANGEAQRD